MSASVIKDYLESIGVDVKEHGTDVGVNDLNIDCPWCGKEKHLGIHRQKAWLNCWACSFAGLRRRPWLADLIVELEGIPYKQAKEQAQRLLSDSNYEDTSAELFDRPGSVWLPEQCFTFFDVLKDDHQEASQALARCYLHDRGISDAMISQYRLLYTTLDLTTGNPWRGRILVPFYEQGQMVSWVGRDYTTCAAQRYLNCPVQKSPKRPKELLYGIEQFQQSRCTHARIVEGVFDKFTVGVTGLAVSKGGHSLEQLLLLRQLKLQAATIIFDPTTFEDRYSLHRAVNLAKELSIFVKGPVKILRLTTGDVNELGWNQVAQIEAATPAFCC